MRLRKAALRNKPWLHSTGPKTPEGKARSSQNGRYLQTDAMSRRGLQNELCEIHVLLAGLAATRQAALGEE
jgi:hypothetical protein